MFQHVQSGRNVPFADDVISTLHSVDLLLLSVAVMCFDICPRGVSGDGSLI